MKRFTMLATFALALSCGSPGSTRVGENEAPLGRVDPPEVLETEPGALRTEAARSEVVFDPIREDDVDGDGVLRGLDLDDDDPDIGAPVVEIPCSGADEDGDGADWCPPDLDGDGARSDIDCFDLDASRHPFAPEERCNGADENCDGWDDCDEDQDGVLDRVDPDPTAFTEIEGPGELQ
jgi:hypothetical protein